MLPQRSPRVGQTSHPNIATVYDVGEHNGVDPYDKTPLNAKVEGLVQDTADWREEKITFDVAYNKERMAAYLFLPKKVRAPFQTVVFFPSARVLDISNSQTLGDIKFFDYYIVQSGRAVLYPIYKGTYERRLNDALPGTSQELEYMAQRFKDLGRSVDYLETRDDIGKNKLAYLGVSMGSAEGVIHASFLQDRGKEVVFVDGGFFVYHPPTFRPNPFESPRPVEAHACSSKQLWSAKWVRLLFAH